MTRKPRTNHATQSPAEVEMTDHVVMSVPGDRTTGKHCENITDLLFSKIEVLYFCT